jgi:hypothetical protein
MRSIASLQQLPRGLYALRKHRDAVIEAENALLSIHERLNERIARLASVEDELQNEFLFPAVARFGADFDGWWRDLPAERVIEVYEYLNTMAGCALTRGEAEHMAWSAYMDAFHVHEQDTPL